MTKEKILAVVVTFNRKALVPQTLDALKAQTWPVDRVIVIDNASSDGTPEALRARGFLDDPLVDYVRMETNTGGAGGFHEGMKRAMAAGADWIWVMDDDVAAAPDCLEQLLKWRHISECLHPRRRHPDGADFEWEHFVDIFTGSRTALGNISFKNGKEIAFTNSGCFEGMLVTTRVVRLAGLPDRKYFISDDDTLFGILASAHTNNAFVRDATMTRLGPPQSGLAPWRAYYVMRNRFFLFRDLCTQLDLRVYPSTKPRFVLLRAIEVVLSLSHGLRHFTRTLSGFVHGLTYLLAANRQ